MDISSFKVENYKSIEDTTRCYLSPDMTILAGKNESGKSATLEALRDFDTSIAKISKSVNPNHLNTSQKPKITLWVKMNDTETSEILGMSPGEFHDQLRELFSKEVDFYKTVTDKDGVLYHSIQLWNLKGSSKKSTQQETLSSINTLIEELNSIPPFNFDKVDDFDGTNTELVELATGILNKVSSSSSNSKEDDSEIKKSLEERISEDILTLARRYDVEIPYHKIIEFIKSTLPKFIYFSSFDDQLPFQIALNEADKNSALNNFLSVAEIELNTIASMDDKLRRDNTLKGHSVKLTGDFMEFWKQDEITLIAKIDGDDLRIEFEEKDKVHNFKFEQRSKGFQWFLTFYLKLISEGNGEQNTFILVDEPGLYLHAKAQKDVLRVFEKLSKDGSDIIFSTHSPYLLDSERLDRIRLITKSKSDGTTISNKIHKNIEADALTPIITAIGMDVTSNLSLVNSKNVIVEGITDYLLIEAFREAYGSPDKLFSIVPGASASKVNYLVSLMIGWGLDYTIVLDTDRSGLNAAKELEKFGISSDEIILYSDSKDFEVEDMFSIEDFRKYFLNLKDEAKISKNSRYVKSNKIDKVVLSKKFNENIRNNKISIDDLEQETKDNFASLYSKIEQALYPTDD